MSLNFIFIDVNSWLDSILFPAIRFNDKASQVSFAGKKIVITGASFGIGEQIALELARFDTTLFLIARTETKLLELQQRMLKMGCKVEIFATDLRAEAHVQACVDWIASKTEKMDLVIHAAGLSIRRSFAESQDRFHDVQRTNAINYLAPVQLSMALFPLLQSQQGAVVYLSAINILFPSFPLWSAYQSSKKAFEQWFLSVAPEMHAAHVNTLLVYLPLVKTRMIAPTKQYDRAPAMSAEHAARWVLRGISKRKKVLKSWWTGIAVPLVWILQAFIRRNLLQQIQDV